MLFFNWLFLIRMLFWLWSIPFTLWVFYSLIWTWIHQHDYANHRKDVEMWKEKFKKEVAGGWYFYDGVGG